MLHEVTAGRKDAKQPREDATADEADPERLVHGAMNGAGAAGEGPVHQDGFVPDEASQQRKGEIPADEAFAAAPGAVNPANAEDEAGEEAGSSPGGTRERPHDRGSSQAPSLADAINLEALKPEADREKTAHPTLIERLRGIGDESEAKDSPPRSLRR